jgi:enamine deaminase RidA (YjgF/YER057c/UK114 family)
MTGLYPGVPYAYAAVAAGATLFSAGACPLDKHGDVVAPGDYEAQARRALANLLAALAEAGAGPGDLVRTTVYVVPRDRADLVRVWDVVAAGLAPHRPPSTLLGVALLGYREQLVEIDGIAALRRA